MDVSDLPTLNACLNATSAILLSFGYYFVRVRRLRAHKKCMAAAFTVSTAFLASYLTYHAFRGSTLFQHPGPIRVVYLSILASHILLAFAVPPLAIITLYFALRARFDKHRRIARWTWPIWMYVSVTGVIVYLMLYHLFPSPHAT